MPKRRAGCYDRDVAANIYQAVKQAMQDLVAPQLESLKGELATTRAQMQANHAALSARIDQVDEKLSGRIAHVEDKLTSELRRGDGTLTTEIRRLDERLALALDVRERIVAIETRLGLLQS